MEKDIDETDLEIWKTVVSVQMHFNDLELRIRNFAIVSLGAIMTVAGYSLRDNNVVFVMGSDVPFASIVLFIGVIVWLCFWYMDRHWYHRLLLGAVKHAIKIENEYQKKRPTLSLSKTIKEESPHNFFGRKARSHDRLNFFYWTIALVLLTTSLAMFAVTFAALTAIVGLILGFIIYFVTTEGVET